MRKLFCIPIIHAPEDLGSHLAAVRREYIARHGLSKWRDHNKAICKFWQELSETFLALPVDYTKVKLYQDGLPVCGKEMEIIEKLEEAGNRNYKLLFKLVKKGATAVGSEDIKLLMEERDRLIKKGVADPEEEAGLYDELMERRDEYIAQRIASTLNDGEIGLLFIGALHRVVERLPKDIQVHESLNDLKETI